ncbi:gliding motility-associated C-terminal domain-containing protein [Mucilaginibacter polytrichastri]|uniref:gliding motility-associated C-terminal domain-containing protein n=1 Tax=Mucilaginibacter polytrichastri TaxID=1302689 RepID=UPI0015879DE3|nr:gliding motility-associated C-terminal domain-containing protein [Mucilaginibacter polytrichastri]
MPLQLSATGGDTYDWTAPNGTHYPGPNPTITPAAIVSDGGIYHLTITTNGCPTFTSTTVTVYQPATIDPITQPAPVCEGGSVQLMAHALNTTHYKWSPSAGLDHDDIANPVATPAITTTYTLTVSNDGCSAPVPPASVTVTVLKNPVANAGKTIKIFAGQAVKLNGTAQGDGVSHFWTSADWTSPYFLDDPTSLTPIAKPPQDITYRLLVKSAVGCGISTSDVFVRVYQQLTIPNAFSPNGDGTNDKWDIKNIETYPNALVRVFNRYGQQVFQSRGYGIPWDGTFNGALLPVGTYYYIIDLQEDDLPKQSGWVFIAR